MIDARMQTGLAPELFARLVGGNVPRVGEGNTVFTGAVRLSWPSLKEKTVMKGQEGKATPKYSASGLWPHKNIAPVADAVRAAIRLHYPNVTDPSVMMNPRDKNHPLKDQGLKVSTGEGGLDPVNKTTAGYVPGLPFCTAKSGQSVPCFRHVGGRSVMILPEELDKVLYAGCWVDLKLVVLKSTSAGNPGVFFGLQGLFKLADDTPFGGGGGAATADDFSGAVAIEDPNANQIMQSAGAAASSDW